MDFASAILLLVMYYLRPQEWMGMFNKLHPIQLLSVMAVWSLISRDHPLKLRDFFRTPHDWIMTAYFAWTTFASPTPWFTFKSISSVILIYFVCVQGLTNLMRMRKLMGWWSALILIIALLAIASEYGFDPLGGYDITHGRMKDRLILNLSVFNNPNALAHSVVPVIPMLFFLLFWKRTATKLWLVILALPLWCIYLTVSKGAFLCTGAIVLATLCFGRPILAQAIIVSLAAGFGWAALNQLPRMNELKNAKTDPAIQGRIAAYTFGLKSMREHFYGLGLGNFKPQFFRYGPLEYPEHPKKVHTIVGGRDFIKKYYYGHHYSKATHGSYNQNGAELGYVGLFLFVGIMYCCMRTVLTAKTTTVEEERMRRILFCIIMSYAVSSWMVDFAYRPTFFIFVAATGAFHRHLRGLLPWQVKPEEAKSDSPWQPRAPTLVPALAKTSTQPIQHFDLEDEMLDGSKADTQTIGDVSVKIAWNKIGLIDLALMFCSTLVVVKYWEHLIKTF